MTDYTPQEAEQIRTEHINKTIIPLVNFAFENYPSIDSVLMLLAQFWCDEAIDAVHRYLVYFSADTPDLETLLENLESTEPLDPKLEKFLDESDDFTFRILDEYEKKYGKYLFLNWVENGVAIAGFAAYCEECDSDTSWKSWAPYAIFQRKENNEVEIKIVGEMRRPWLNGVKGGIFDDW